MSGSHQRKGGAGPPCGACRFLRRKCVKGTCVFAPYFDSDQGAAHFAAVHKVFGASNASKMLMLVPPHRRLDTVVALCYEAVARVSDPVYGCVAHIFNLQQQVVNLQAELAYIQARLSTLQCRPLPSSPLQTPNSTSNFQPSTELTSTSTVPTCIDPSPLSEMVSFCGLFDGQVNDDGDLQAIAHEFLSKYLPGVLRPSSS